MGLTAVTEGRHSGGMTTTETYQPPVANGFAITSMVLGICSLIMGLWLIPQVLAIVFGGIAIQRANAAGVQRSGMAVAGLTLGCFFGVLYGGLWVVMMASA